MITATDVYGHKHEFLVESEDAFHKKMAELEADPKIVKTEWRQVRRAVVKREPCPYRDAAMRNGKRGKP